ncbi:unnamed protein product [Microthlaspi erraticum]|uniref:Integrase catalytic domain-containing protein n=1 Tax=Microthlaspi erraticum TaxID=1685480 RepID=A0A6D2I9Q3_9BRAS|nr:unnamed protein product [Microthlaspi erraticum]
MTGNLSLLHNLETILPCSIGFADGGKTVSLRKGVLTLSSPLTLPNVLFVQDLNCTLISVSKLLKQTGGIALFSDTLCVLQDRFSRTLIGAGEERDGVYYFKDVMAARIHRAIADSDSTMWHQRLGHPSFYVLSSLLLFSGVSKPSEVSKVMKNFFVYAEKQFGKSVKMVRSDNGTEFMCLSSYFREKGVVHQTSCVGTPQQNGRVERKHKHILNVALALLFQGNLPIKFWGEAVLTAAYLINRTPSAVHLGRSPYELLHGHKPSYDQLRAFGSECYTHRVTRDKDKFGQRSQCCVFLSYPVGKKAWKVFDIEREEFIVSRDVVFKETVFPFSVTNPFLPQFSPSACVDDDWLISSIPFVVRGSGSPETPSVAVNPQEPEAAITQEPVTEHSQEPVSANPQEPASTTVTETSPRESVSVQNTAGVPSTDSDPPLGRGLRQKAESVKLRDYITYYVVCSQDPHHAPPDPTSQSSSVQDTSLYPLSHYISDEVSLQGRKLSLRP